MTEEREGGIKGLLASIVAEQGVCNGRSCLCCLAAYLQQEMVARHAKNGGGEPVALKTDRITVRIILSYVTNATSKESVKLTHHRDGLKGKMLSFDGSELDVIDFF